MSEIRVIWRSEPPVPAINQHPDAVRYPFTIDGEQVYVDAVGGEPTIEEVQAVLNPPPPPEPTITQKLEAAGITLPELRAALGLPAV